MSLRTNGHISLNFILIKFDNSFNYFGFNNYIGIQSNKTICAGSVKPANYFINKLWQNVFQYNNTYQSSKNTNKVDIKVSSWNSCNISYKMTSSKVVVSIVAIEAFLSLLGRVEGAPPCGCIDQQQQSCVIDYLSELIRQLIACQQPPICVNQTTTIPPTGTTLPVVVTTTGKNQT